MKQSMRHWLRPRLARDITIILTLKLIALIAIKLVWFSTPPTSTISDIGRMLLSSMVQVAQ